MTWLTAILTLVLTVSIGTALQLLLWHTPEEPFSDAMTSKPLMWIVYFFVAVFLAEYICGILNTIHIRRSSKKNPADGGKC